MTTTIPPEDEWTSITTYPGFWKKFSDYHKQYVMTGAILKQPQSVLSLITRSNIKRIFLLITSVLGWVYFMTFLRIFRNPILAAMPPSPIVQAISETNFLLAVFIPIVIMLFLVDHNSALPYMVAYVVPVFAWYYANRGDFFHILFLVHGLIPILEIVFGGDGVNPTKEESIELNQRNVFRWITMAWAPTQLILITWACWFASTYPLTLGQLFLFSLSIGANTGILGINVSHELIHKSTWEEQTLGRIILVSVCYGHFYIEHLLGHHKHVSTPEDPASSRRNESFYSFYPRTVIGSWTSAWHIEKDRLAKLGYGVWSIYNQNLHFVTGSALLAIGFFVLWGWKALFIFLCQSWFAFSLLELVNYIEHYGLRRKKTEKGYEAVRVIHSWNSDARASNFFLFKLQRHSDHHAYASRRYQILRSFFESPQMPTGYGGMVVLALFPPLWFRIVNPLLDQWISKQETPAQVSKESFKSD